MTLQAFKENDTVEAQVVAAALPALVPLGFQRDIFFDEAFEAAPLGDVLFDLDRDPMVGVIPREVFRVAFFAIHALFTRPGTFEFYLEVFRAIWGADVEVEFVVPAPGQLEIGVTAIATGTAYANARRIEDDLYIYDKLVDEDGDYLLFQYPIGTRTQAEVDALILQIAPAAILTTVTLTY